MTGIYKLRLLASGFFLFFFCTASPSFAEIVVVPMQYRSAAEALPMVREFLSSRGRAVADPRSNSILLEDDQASIQRMREFLESFDLPARQGTMKVRFDETGSWEGRSAEVRGRASGRDWSAAVGKPRTRDGVEVRGRERRRDEQGTSEFFLAVVSGSPAYIMVGQDLLFTQRWLELSRRYARISETVTIQRMETGMEVRPTFLKDYAAIDVIPRISGTGTERGVIRFTEAATRLLAPYGQWFVIGGASLQSSEVMAEILAWGRGEGRSVVSISVLVEARD